MPVACFPFFFFLNPIISCFPCLSSSDLGINTFLLRRGPLSASISSPTGFEQVGSDALYVFHSFSWQRILFLLVKNQSPFCCIRRNPTLVMAEIDWLLLSFSNLHCGDPPCGLGTQLSCGFAVGVALPALGVVCPIKGHSFDADEARAKTRSSASTSSTSGSSFVRSIRGPNSGSLLRASVAAGVHLRSAAKVRDRCVCNLAGCVSSTEGATLHVASTLGRLGHVFWQGCFTFY